jgi:hypothetical protein
LSAEFEPSPVSRTPNEQALAALRYIRKAVDVIEAYVLSQGTTTALPAWVSNKIVAAGRGLGTVVSVVAQAQKPVLRRKKK